MKEGILEEGLSVKESIGLTFMEPPQWVKGLIFIIPLNHLNKPLRTAPISLFYR